VLQLELKKLDMLVQHPELSDVLMKHTELTYRHMEKMLQQGDTEEDDADHSIDMSALQAAIGGN